MLSAITHQFRRENVHNDGLSLYTSFRYVIGLSNTINNEYLHSIVTNYLQENFGIVSYNDDDKIEILANLYNKLVRLVSKTKTGQGKYMTNIFKYGEHLKTIDGCVYIFYNGETHHYEPLYLVNKQNMNDILTIFQNHNEEFVFELLFKFIREDLNDDGFVQLGSREIDSPSELPTNTEVLDETEQIINQLVPDAGMNNSINRIDHIDLSFSKTILEY